MRFKVPQDVQREDQILWFITLRQLVLLLIGFGISYTMFVNMKEKYDLTDLELIMIWMPAALCTAFAFVKIKGIGLFQFCLLLIEQLFFRRGRRYWIQNGGDAFFSMTTSVSPLKKKKEVAEEEKDVSQEKIKNLAKFLDGEKSDFAPDTDSINKNSSLSTP